MCENLRQQTFAVCCPLCGRQHLRSGNMTAEIFCKKCKIVFVANVTNEGVKVFPSRRMTERVSFS